MKLKFYLFTYKKISPIIYNNGIIGGGVNVRPKKFKIFKKFCYGDAIN